MWPPNTLSTTPAAEEEAVAGSNPYPSFSTTSTTTVPSLFECGDCGRGFSKKCAYVIHRQIHTGEKPFLCHMCGNTFSQIGHWRRHSKGHTDNPLFQPKTAQSQKTKLYECQKCERPHKCSRCGKTFKLIHHLHRHEKVPCGVKVKKKRSRKKATKAQPSRHLVSTKSTSALTPTTSPPIEHLQDDRTSSLWDNFAAFPSVIPPPEPPMMMTGEDAIDDYRLLDISCRGFPSVVSYERAETQEDTPFHLRSFYPVTCYDPIISFYDY